MRSALAKAGWLARNTRFDLLFRVQRLLQDKDKPDARVEYLLDFNRLVTEAQGDSGLQSTFEPIDLDLTTMLLIVPGDSSWGNVDDGMSSQAGHMIFLAHLPEFEKMAQARSAFSPPAATR